MYETDKARRPWLPAFVVTTIVFVSGMIVGGTLVSHVLWRHQVDAAQHPKFQGEGIIRQLDRKFELTDDQRGAIRAAVRRHHEELESIRRETEPRIREVFESMQEEIAGMLHPDQTEYWERRIDRMNERWLRHHRPPEHRRFRRQGPGGGWPPIPPERMEELDRDGDGRFSFEELSLEFPDMDERRFRHLDEDGDGFVTPEELMRAGDRRPERRRDRR